MDYLASPLRHLAVVREWMSHNGAEGNVNPFSFVLSIRQKNRRIAFAPKFVFRHEGRLAYTEQFRDEESVFVGWMPYPVKRWDVSADKLQFKDLMLTAGLRVPEGIDPGAAANDYIVKRRRGSFGQDMAGPYEKDRSQVLNPEQFAEAFIDGRSAKAWYWAGILVAVEIIDRPYIQADGLRTLASIANTPRGSFDHRYSIEKSAEFIEYQGFSASNVSEKGRRIFLDYRHASIFDRVAKSDRNVLDTLSAELRRQFVDAGGVCAEHIAGIDSRERLFTLDAVVDASNVAWFLEINSNPMVHPKAYPLMLQSIFGRESRATNGRDVAIAGKVPA